jgi:hypothetical protein
MPIVSSQLLHIVQSLRPPFAVAVHVAMQHFFGREQNNTGMPIWLFSR